MRRILVGMLMVLAAVGLTACGLSEAETKYNAGTDKFNNKDLDGALADFNEAIRLDANLAVAYMNRGAVYASKGEYDKAIEDETKAIDLKLSRAEDQATAYTNRAAAYVFKQEFDKALADAEEAIKAKGDYAKGYLMRGLAHAAKGTKDSAIADLKKVVELAKDSEEGKVAQQTLDQLEAAP